jgi:hypothetical protein
MDTGEVETACLHLAQDIAADIVVLAAHESSSCKAMDRLSVHYAPAGSAGQIELMQDAN